MMGLMGLMGLMVPMGLLLHLLPTVLMGLLLHPLPTDPMALADLTDRSLHPLLMVLMDPVGRFHLQDLLDLLDLMHQLFLQVQLGLPDR